MLSDDVFAELENIGAIGSKVGSSKPVVADTDLKVEPSGSALSVLTDIKESLDILMSSLSLLLDRVSALDTIIAANGASVSETRKPEPVPAEKPPLASEDIADAPSAPAFDFIPGNI